MIATERAAGSADAGPDAEALASVLLDLNDHALNDTRSATAHPAKNT